MVDRLDIVITNYIAKQIRQGILFTTEEGNSYNTHSNASYSISN